MADGPGGNDPNGPKPDAVTSGDDPIRDDDKKEDKKKDSKDGRKEEKDEKKEEIKEPEDLDESRKRGPATHSVSTEKLFGGAGVNLGTQIISIGRESLAVSPSFEQDLKTIPVPATPKTPAPPEEVRRYATLLQNRRVLVIAHATRREREAESAMRSLLWFIHESEPTRPQATSAFGRTFPLHSFYENPEWPKNFCGSLIYLNRSRDIATSAFFENDDKVILLRNQLQAVNACLVITANAENHIFTDARSEIDSWLLLPGAEPTSPSDLSATYTTALEITVALCAALFPGLGAREFVELVEKLAPAKPATPSPPPTNTSPDDSTNRTTPPSPPTRDERWWSGERDTVLRELGVVFSRLPEGGTADAGFIIADEDKRAAMPAWILEHFPVLLTQHIPILTERYFSTAASTTFRIGFLNLLFRMEAHRLFRLTPEWLLLQFTAIPQRERPFESSHHFAALLVKAMDSANGDALVDKVIGSVADDVIQCEVNLLHSVPEEVFESAAHAAADPSAEDPTDAFWSELWNATTSRPLMESAGLRLRLAIEVLIEISRHRPSAVVEGVKRLLGEEALESTRWSEVLTDARLRARITRLPHLAFQWKLVQMVEQDLSQWAAFAQVMVGDGQSHDDDAEDDSPATADLASDCLATFAEWLSDVEPNPLPDAAYDALFSETRRPRTGRLLSNLVLSQERFDAAFVVWLYRALTTTLLAREGAVPSAVSAAIFELIAPLRADVRGPQRLAITQRAHQHQEHYFARRDYFSRIGAREPLRLERSRIQAMHIVIRALSGIRPSPTPTASA